MQRLRLALRLVKQRRPQPQLCHLRMRMANSVPAVWKLGQACWQTCFFQATLRCILLGHSYRRRGRLAQPRVRAAHLLWVTLGSGLPGGPVRHVSAFGTDLPAPRLADRHNVDHGRSLTAAQATKHFIWTWQTTSSGTQRLQQNLLCIRSHTGPDSLRQHLRQACVPKLSLSIHSAITCKLSR